MSTAKFQFGKKGLQAQISPSPLTKGQGTEMIGSQGKKKSTPTVPSREKQKESKEADYLGIKIFPPQPPGWHGEIHS